MAKKKIRGQTIKLADANKADYIVRKNDGINIDTVTFPSDVQIGLASGKNSNLTVTGLIKGSIQETKDGLPYLVAGTGITIATGSNGQVTIETSGGGASGDITSVIAGNGLTGGGLTGDVTLNVGSGTGITVNTDNIQTNDSEIVHDNLSGFVSNEHIDHSGVSITAGDGLTGGGDLTTTRTISVGAGTGIDVDVNSISVDVSDFMSNGAPNRILTAAGPDTMQAESLLLFDGTTLSVPNKLKVSGDAHLTNTDPFLVTNSTNLKIQSSGSIWAQIDDAGDKTSSFRIYSGSQLIMNVESSDFSTSFPAGDVFITNNNDLRLNTGGTIVLDNNSDSEVYLSSSSGLGLEIDGNNTLSLYADNNLYHYLGDHQAGTYSRNSFHAGSNTFNLDNDDMDFRVHTNNYAATFFVDSADDTIIIGAQDFDSTPSASELLSKGYGNDIKIMLSGTYGSKDSSTRGVVLMTGDTAVSGNLYIVGDTNSKRRITSSGSMDIKSINGTTAIIGDNNVNVWIGYDGNGSNQSFSIYKGTGGYEQIFVVNEDKSVRIFGELDVENNLVVHLDYDSDNSNSYFGTKNGGGTFNQVFYEDGRAYFNYGSQSTGDFIVNGDNDYGLIFVDAGEDAIALGCSTDISPDWSELTETGTDVKILLSGSAGSKDTATKGVILAAGDLVVSGTLYDGSGNQINGNITSVSAGNGLTGGGSSGDITLNIGAGGGINVTASNISVDVSDFMTNGSDNRVITATGTDAMNAEENLTYDGSTLTITTTTSLTNGLLYIDSNDPTLTSGDSLIVMDSSDITMASSNYWISFKQDGTLVGSINSEVAYTTFTGQHPTILTGSNSQLIEKGMILCSNGNVFYRGNGISNAWVQTEISSTSYDKKVVGVYAGEWTNDGIVSGSLSLYNAIGEGLIYVTDESGNIDVGDYICSSNRLGMGMKQSDDILHNYTVAKATEKIDFSLINNDPILGYKKTLMACTYHCG